MTEKTNKKRKPKRDVTIIDLKGKCTKWTYDDAIKKLEFDKRYNFYYSPAGDLGGLNSGSHYNISRKEVIEDINRVGKKGGDLIMLELLPLELSALIDRRNEYQQSVRDYAKRIGAFAEQIVYRAINSQVSLDPNVSNIYRRFNDVANAKDDKEFSRKLEGLISQQQS